jgi:hypothetical protein
MSEWKLHVPTESTRITHYKCGLVAGQRVRLKKDIVARSGMFSLGSRQTRFYGFVGPMGSVAHGMMMPLQLMSVSRRFDAMNSPNQRVERTRGSRFAPRQIVRHRRLAPVADLCRRQSPPPNPTPAFPLPRKRQNTACTPKAAASHNPQPKTHNPKPRPTFPVSSLRFQVSPSLLRAGCR